MEKNKKQHRELCKAAFQITYLSFVLLVRTAAALIKYVLLHAVSVQLGHATLIYTGFIPILTNTFPWRFGKFP